jgi:MFS transporter, UMF1 family
MEKALSTPQAVKKARHAWYFYDFGNSAYAAVVLLAVYSSYFSNVVVGKAHGPTLWNYAVGIAAIIVAVTSPVMGTIADFSKSKKKFLFFFSVMAVVFTGLLFFVQAGDVFTGMLFFILAEIGYRAAQVFYDALLVDVSTPETIGDVSGKGWAMGMLGGIACLLLVLVPIQLFPGNTLVIRLAFVITAIFFAIASIPMFLRVRQLNEPEKLPAGETTIGHAFKSLGNTFRDVKKYKEFMKYAVAFLIYNDGIMMLMDNAALIGGILYGMKTAQLIILIIILQVTGAAGAYLFGKISNKQSSKESLLYSLIILIVAIIGLFFFKSMIAFYIIGGIAGFSLSGVQAVSRTMVSQLTPHTKTAEFYGFLSVAGRTSTFIGPVVYGSVYALMLNRWLKAGVDEAAAKAHGVYWALGAVLAFLVIGLLLLQIVRRVTHKEPLKFED